MFRGRFTPGLHETEWCARRLLAQDSQLHAESIATGDRTGFERGFYSLSTGVAEACAGSSGRRSRCRRRALIDQLEGFEAPSSAWEGEIFPSRVTDYDPAALDSLCLSGRVIWARLTPPKTGGDRLSHRARCALRRFVAQPEDASLWNSLFPGTAREDDQLSSSAADCLRVSCDMRRIVLCGLVDGTGLLRTQVEDALGELVACGLVTADSFTGLRALLTPSNRRTNAAMKRGHATYEMTSAGRWSLLGRRAFSPADQPSMEKLARILLRRYGVVFKRVLDREGFELAWRELLKVYHRLEARGEIRGGRFVAGFSGEQFALPEAVGMLRAIRRTPSENRLITVSAADPLNLVGIITPGDKLASYAGNRVLYRDGVPLATLESGEVRFLVELDPATQWAAKNALVRRSVASPELRSYLTKPA